MPRKKMSEEERRKRKNAQYSARNKKSRDTIIVFAHKRYRFAEIMTLAIEKSGAKSANAFYVNALLNAAAELGITIDVLPPLPESQPEEEQDMTADHNDEKEEQDDIE